MSDRTLTALKFAREHLVGCVRDMEYSQEEIARLETELQAAREELAEHVEAEKLARAMVSLLEGATSA